MKVTDKFVFFYGGLLSQWADSPFEANLGGEIYTFPTAEHFMMAAKAIMFQDREAFQEILSEPSPSKVKALGRKVKNFNPKRWNEICQEIVYFGNLQKFTQNEGHGKFLLNTNDKIIVEASPYDKIWGVGLGENDPRILNPSKWLGSNWLGESLMRVRTFLQNSI